MQPRERRCQSLQKTSPLFRITAMHRCKQQSLCPIMIFEFIFTRDSIYAIAHICHGNSVCLSVCLFVTRVDQSKTVEARITQFSLYSSPIPLVFRGYVSSRNSDGVPPSGGLKGAWGRAKKAIFRPLCSNISKTVKDTTKVTIDH